MTAVAASRCAFSGLLAGCLVALASPAWGQANLLEIRKEFVPATALPEHARGLLPIPRTEFEQILELQFLDAAAPAPQASCYLDHADFQARLQVDQLVEGTARLAIVCTAPEPVLLLLDPCDLTLEGARWEDNRPLTLGRDEQGRLHCRVERSGTLLLQWHHQAYSTEREATRFRLALPPALQRTIELTAAESAHLQIAGAVVAPEASFDQADGNSKWSIRLGPLPEAQLTVLHGAAAATNRRLLLVTEAAHYSVLPAALDVTSKFRCDVLGDSLPSLNLSVETPLRLAAIRLGDEEILWRVPEAQPDSAATLVQCQLPGSFRGANQKLTIEAAAEGPLADGKLPRIKLLDAVLQSATLTVEAPRWMHLSALGSGQIQAVGANSALDSSSDVFSFLQFGDRGTVDLVMQAVLHPLVERSLTSITIEQSQFVGHFSGTLLSHGEEVFSVAAQIPRHWVVDAVDVYPPEMLSERQLNPDNTGTQRLQLKLAQPITEQRPLQLTVRAHYRRSPTIRLSGEDGLRMLRFSAVGQHRRLVNLRVGDPQGELKVSGDASLKRLEIESLPPAERQLLAEQPLGLLFDMDSVSEDFRAGVSPGVPRYRADIRLQAFAEQSGVEQQVSLDCRPEGTTLAAVLVRISPSPGERIVWRLGGDDARDLAATLEPSVAGETIYRVLLPRPATQPVSIVGTWASTYNQPLNLVWLPEASQQSAIVELFSSGEVPLVAAEAVRPLPTAKSEAAADQALFARYSYDSGSRASLQLQPPPSHPSEVSLWIENLETTTYLAPAGNLECSAKLVVHHAGSGLLRFSLADSATDCRQVGTLGEVVLRRGAGGYFELPLPSDETLSTIQLRYIVTRSASPGWPIAQLTLPLPQPSAPVLRRVWIATLPPGQAIYSRGRPYLVRRQVGVVSSANPDEGYDWSGLLDGPSLAMRALSLPELAAGTTNSSSPRGWTDYEREVAAGETVAISYFHPLTFVIYAIFTFLVFWALSSWRQRAAVRRIVGGGMLLAIALAFSAPYSWLVFAAGLGIVVGALVYSVARQPVAAQASPSPRAFSTVSRMAPLLVAAALHGADQAWSAPPEAERQVRRAVIPVDENQRVTGDYVYVDPDLFASLRRPRDKASTAPVWLLERSEYVAAPAATSAEGSLQRITATLVLHTFEKGATVELPFERRRTSLVQGQAKLDGAPAPLRWSSDGRLLLVDVAGPGRHSLRLELATGSPAVSSGPEPNAILIPPAAISQVRRGDDLSFIKTELALGSTLPSQNTTELAEGKIATRQLNLWKVKPAEVVLETQWQLSRKSAPIDKVSLLIDPRLQLLSDNANEIGEFIQPAANESDLLTFRVPQPSEQISLRLRWRWLDGHGVGKLVLPRVSVFGGDVQQDLVALSVDPALEVFKISPEGRAAAVKPFRDAWPEETGELTEASELPALPQRLVVETRPVLRLPSAVHSVDWSLSRSQAHLECQIELSNLAETCNLHEISLPASLTVTDVSVQQAESPVKIRWVQAKSGQVSIRLLDPPQGTQRIALHAEAALPRNATQYALPRMAINSATIAATRVRLFRQPDVQLTLNTDASWEREAQPPESPLVPGRGRLVAQLATAQDLPRSQLQVALQPNQPRVSGQLTTRVEHSNGDWTCRLAADLAIEDGILDQIRVLVPKSWVDDLQVEPPMDFSLEPTTNEDQHILKLEPPAPLRGQFAFRLRGPLLLQGGGIQVPELHVLDAERIDRRVQLAGGGEEFAVNWEISGLAPVLASERQSPAPEKSATANVSPDSGHFINYRVTGPQFRALARYLPDSSRSAEILLLDIHTNLTAARHWVSTARVLIKPASSSRLTFELPPHSRLLDVAVDGRPAHHRKVGVRQWQLPAPSDILPFELSLVFEQLTVSPANDSGLVLTAPRFHGLKRGAILWNLRRPQISLASGRWLPVDREAGELSSPEFAAQEALPGPASDALRTCTPFAAETRRLEAYRDALEAVQSARSATIPKQVLAERAERWEKLALAVDTRLNDLRLNDVATQPATEEEVRRQVALEGIASVHQRLFQAGILTTERPERWPVNDSPPLPEGDATLLVFGETLQLPFGMASSPSSRQLPAWPVPLGVALGVVALAFLLHHPTSQLWLNTHRNAVLALGGLAWWLLAPLGWLGYVAVLAATWLSVRKLIGSSRSSGSPLPSSAAVDLS